jgi:hypothetical protein
MGGWEAAIASGTHLQDLLDQVIFPDEDIDPASLRQLQDLADIMGIAPDGTCPDDVGFGGLTTPSRVAEGQEEPLVSPDAARHWLVTQTHRAIEHGDGSFQLDPDQKPDHLGFAAMAIAKGDEMRRFSDVYAEVTDHKSPLADELILRMAHDLVKRYAEDTQQD